jgi:hypothetical protein
MEKSGSLTNRVRQSKSRVRVSVRMEVSGSPVSPTERSFNFQCGRFDITVHSSQSSLINLSSLSLPHSYSAESETLLKLHRANVPVRQHSKAKVGGLRVQCRTDRGRRVDKDRVYLGAWHTKKMDCINCSTTGCVEVHTEDKVHRPRGPDDGSEGEEE